MKRGDVVTVAAAGDYGKPRLAVVVQTDAFPETHASVVVCQLTSDMPNASDFRIIIEPSNTNGLRVRSQVMVRGHEPARSKLSFARGPRQRLPGALSGRDQWITVGWLERDAIDADLQDYH